jgi:hypothetical protein
VHKNERNGNSEEGHNEQDEIVMQKGRLKKMIQKPTLHITSFQSWA